MPEPLLASSDGATTPATRLSRLPSNTIALRSWVRDALRLRVRQGGDDGASTSSSDWSDECDDRGALQDDSLCSYQGEDAAQRCRVTLLVIFPALYLCLLYAEHQLHGWDRLVGQNSVPGATYSGSHRRLGCSWSKLEHKMVCSDAAVTAAGPGPMGRRSRPTASNGDRKHFSSSSPPPQPLPGNFQHQSPKSHQGGRLGVRSSGASSGDDSSGLGNRPDPALLATLPRVGMFV